MSLYCPHCEQRFPDTQGETCPHDGARLFRRDQLPDDPLVGTVLDGRFRIDAPLSEGGMGAVYRATQLSVQRTVALKVVRPDLEADDVFIDRFFREANVIAGLSHPNIIRLIDFGQDERRDVLYLVMELVHGIELGDLIALGRLTPPLALEITYQVLAGLTQAHARGIIHRDLKPANLIVLPSSDGTVQVKILDFGIARPVEEATQLTQTGMICGTPSYLSPEQAQSEPPKAQSDLYSLGVILFEMLTGHRPFRGPSGLHLLFDHVQRPAPDLADRYPETIPQPLSDFVLNLLEKSPEERPESAILTRRQIQDLRQTLTLAPVFLDFPEDDDLEASFSPWLDDALDPDRLDDSLSSPPEKEGLLTTLDPVDPENASSIALANTAPGGQQDPQSTPDPSDQPSEPSSSRPATTAVREALRAHPIVSASLAIVTAIAVLAALILLSIIFFDEGPRPPSESPSEAAVAHPGSTADDPGVEPQAQTDIEDLNAHFSSLQDTLDWWATFSTPAVVEAPEPDAESPEPDAESPEPDAESPEPELAPPSSEPSDESTEVASARGPEMPDFPRDSSDPPDPPSPSSDDDRTPTGLTHQGSITLESSSQLNFIDHYQEITGDLVIRINTGDISELSLHNLTRLRGSLIIDGLADIETISMPNLERVGRAVMVSQNHSVQRLRLPSLQVTGENLMVTNTSLEEIDIERLSSVGGMLHFSQNTGLENLNFPTLQRVSGSLSILDNAGIQALNLPLLDSVDEEFQILSGKIRHIRAPQLSSIGGGVTVNRTSELQTLNFSSLQQVNTLNLSEISSLDQLSIDALRRVNGHINITDIGLSSALNLTNLRYAGQQITMADNPFISSVDLSSLETLQGNLIITDHSNLQELKLPAQSPLDELILIDNAQLNACPLQSLVEQWQNDGWNGESRLLNLDESQCS